MIPKDSKLVANQPYTHSKTPEEILVGLKHRPRNFSLQRLVEGREWVVWLICLVLIFSFFAFRLPAQAAECRLINILTDKNQVGPEERIQVNVTAQKECIGKTAAIHICDPTGCSEIAGQTFGSRTVNGQQAINPLVFFIVPSQFFNQNTAVFVQATVPFNTVKSQSISIQVSDEEPEDILPGNINEDENNINEDGDISSLSGFPGEDLEANDVINIIIGLSCWLTRVAFTLTVIFVIWVGLKFMAAQGNPTKYGDAVKSFQHALLGILVIYGVYVIIATVANAVGASFSFIPLVC